MILTVASGKGGVGKSNFVVNLGLALAEYGVDVIVVDGNLTNGDVSCLLGPPFPKATIQDVLNGEIDLEQAIFKHPSGVRVISSGLSIDDVTRVDAKDLGKVAKEMSDLAQIVLVDAPGTLGDNTVQSLKLADKVILITTPEITSYANTLKTKKIAESYDVDVLGTVLNKVRRNKARVERELKEWLGTTILFTLPYDESVIEAVEYGKAIVRHRPESSYSTEVRRFAAILANKDYKPPGIFSRALRRVSGLIRL